LFRSLCFVADSSKFENSPRQGVRLCARHVDALIPIHLSNEKMFANRENRLNSLNRFVGCFFSYTHTHTHFRAPIRSEKNDARCRRHRNGKVTAADVFTRAEYLAGGDELRGHVASNGMENFGERAERTLLLRARSYNGIKNIA